MMDGFRVLMQRELLALANYSVARRETFTLMGSTQGQERM
jgi:hypothetical protein